MCATLATVADSSAASECGADAERKTADGGADGSGLVQQRRCAVQLPRAAPEHNCTATHARLTRPSSEQRSSEGENSGRLRFRYTFLSLLQTASQTIFATPRDTTTSTLPRAIRLAGCHECTRGVEQYTRAGWARPQAESSGAAAPAASSRPAPRRAVASPACCRPLISSRKDWTDATRVQDDGGCV